MKRTVKTISVDYAKIVFSPDTGANLITETREIYGAGHDIETALKILSKEEGKTIKPISYQKIEREYSMPDTEFLKSAKIDSETIGETEFI